MTNAERILHAERAILAIRLEEKKDDTLFVQLLTSEIGLIVLGNNLVRCLLPALDEACEELHRKLREVSDAQDFFRKGE